LEIFLNVFARIYHGLSYLWQVAGFKPGIVLGNVDVEDDVTFVRGSLDCHAAKLPHTHTHYS